MMQKLPTSRNENLVIQETSQEILIYDLTTHKAFGLNQTAAIIYRACDGRTTFDELKQRHQWSDEIIFLALDGLKGVNLIPEDEIYDSPFRGMSRRDAIKKVGLASLIALPVISSIVAPSSAMAQSGLRSLFASCGAPAQCQSGNCAQIPFVNSSICCVPGSTSGRTFQTYIASQGTCAGTAVTACCSGSGRFLNPVGDGSFGQDICQCT